MKPKIILRLDTDDMQIVKTFADKLTTTEIAVIPEHVKILIKDKEGYWNET